MIFPLRFRYSSPSMAQPPESILLEDEPHPVPVSAASSPSVVGANSVPQPEHANSPFTYRISVFSGVEDFTTWKAAFLYAVEVNAYSCSVAAKVLGSSLSGEALSEFLSFSDAVKSDYRASLEKLGQIFAESNVAMHLRFRSISMLPYENVHSYKRRLLRTFAGAFPSLLGTPAADLMLKTQFIHGLTSESIKRKLLYDDPKDFDATVGAAATLFGIDQVSASSVPDPVFAVSSHDSLVQAVSSKPPEHVAMQKLSERVDAIESQLSSLQSVRSDVQTLSQKIDDLATRVTSMCAPGAPSQPRYTPQHSDVRPPILLPPRPVSCLRCGHAHLTRHCTIPRESLFCQSCSRVGHHASACRTFPSSHVQPFRPSAEQLRARSSPSSMRDQPFPSRP